MTEEKKENIELEVKETPAQEEKKVVETAAAEEKPEVVVEETAAEEKEVTIVDEEVKTEEVKEIVAEEAKTEEVTEIVPEVVAKEKTKKAKKPTAEAEEFDWASLETGLDIYSEKERDDYANLYNGTLNTVLEKEVIEGTVISLNKREVVIDIGYKSDGIVSLNEFRYNPELKVGDKVDVFIDLSLIHISEPTRLRRI